MDSESMSKLLLAIVDRIDDFLKERKEAREREEAEKITKEVMKSFDATVAVMSESFMELQEEVKSLDELCKQWHSEEEIGEDQSDEELKRDEEEIQRSVDEEKASELTVEEAVRSDEDEREEDRSDEDERKDQFEEQLIGGQSDLEEVNRSPIPVSRKVSQIRMEKNQKKISKRVQKLRGIKREQNMYSKFRWKWSSAWFLIKRWRRKKRWWRKADREKKFRDEWTDLKKRWRERRRNKLQPWRFSYCDRGEIYDMGNFKTRQRRVIRVLRNRRNQMKKRERIMKVYNLRVFGKNWRQRRPYKMQWRRRWRWRRRRKLQEGEDERKRRGCATKKKLQREGRCRRRNPSPEWEAKGRRKNRRRKREETPSKRKWICQRRKCQWSGRRPHAEASPVVGREATAQDWMGELRKKPYNHSRFKHTWEVSGVNLGHGPGLSKKKREPNFKRPSAEVQKKLNTWMMGHSRSPSQIGYQHDFMGGPTLEATYEAQLTKAQIGWVIQLMGNLPFSHQRLEAATILPPFGWLRSTKTEVLTPNWDDLFTELHGGTRFFNLEGMVFLFTKPLVVECNEKRDVKRLLIHILLPEEYWKFKLVNGLCWDCTHPPNISPATAYSDMISGNTIEIQAGELTHDEAPCSLAWQTKTMVIFVGLPLIPFRGWLCMTMVALEGHQWGWARKWQWIWTQMVLEVDFGGSKFYFCEEPSTCLWEFTNIPGPHDFVVFLEDSGTGFSKGDIQTQRVSTGGLLSKFEITRIDGQSAFFIHFAGYGENLYPFAWSTAIFIWLILISVFEWHCIGRGWSCSSVIT